MYDDNTKKGRHSMPKRISRFFYKALHFLEFLIAILTITVLAGIVGFEVYKMFVTDGYFLSANTYLQNILTVVVGLEFVRMLIDTTPANILEVLTVAMTRHIILTHDDYWSNLVCVACIGGLFAIRRFLVRKHELKEEMVEIE